MLDLSEAQPLARRPRPEPDVERRLEVRLVDRDGRATVLPDDGRRSAGFRASIDWQPLPNSPGIIRAWQLEVSIVSHEAHDGLGVQLVLPLGTPATHVMIPGLVYGENRTIDCRVRYPRVAADAGAADSLTSSRWAFRADRASHPVVFAWTDSTCVALATEETSSLGLSGLSFDTGESSYLAINFPAREEPVTFVGQDAAAPPEAMTHAWQDGEIAVLRLKLFILPNDRHAYDAVLRRLYEEQRDADPLNPWMSADQAASLAAHGLYRWHYRPETATFAETVAFHRERDESAAVTGDREAMHVAWLSGAPTAYALLQYAALQGIAEYLDAGLAVLDKISEGLAPCGAFWGRWTPSGWDGGWNGHHDRIHSRTIAEASLFLLRAIAFERTRGIEHPAWLDAAASNLRFIAAAQREDGALPSLINGQTGTVESWSGAAGMLWIPAMLEGDQTKETVRLAAHAGGYYARFIEDEFIFGAPEDIDLAPSSEDGYNAVIAYVSLYEATGERRWLDLARRAAEWMLSFRWAYNLSFPAHTVLNTYDYRSRGADLASPRNQHLHTYGLICLPELARLSEHSGDAYYRERALDNLASSLQFIAREDGDFNARKGMVTERYYNTRCFGPKGAILPVSHAWSAGLVLYACQAGLALDS
jgi:hypothetical protein